MARNANSYLTHLRRRTPGIRIRAVAHPRTVQSLGLFLSFFLVYTIVLSKARFLRRSSQIAGPDGPGTVGVSRIFCSLFTRDASLDTLASGRGTFVAPAQSARADIPTSSRSRCCNKYIGGKHRQIGSCRNFHLSSQ